LREVIQRIPRKIGGGEVFTEAEEVRLVGMLELDGAAEVREISGALAFVYERAASQGASPEALTKALSAAGAGEALAGLAGEIWRELGPALLQRLKQIPFGAPEVLTGVNWQVNVPISGSEASVPEPRPSALFDLELTGGSSEPRHVKMQLSAQELQGFFDKVELIQEQLDALS